MRLDGWDEIAGHLGTTVRTAQNREKSGGLPVHRVPGSKRGRVFAYTAEIDAWLQGIPAGNKSWPWWWALAPLPAVLVVVFLLIGNQEPTGPQSCYVEGHAIRVTDTLETTLWTKSFPGLVTRRFSNREQLCRVVDLTGDDHAEILFAHTNIDKRGSELLCFDHEGTLLWPLRQISRRQGPTP